MAGADRATDGLIGRQLGDFVVTERIGSGGFGVVYRAEQISLSRDAVIKVLHRQIAGEEVVVERFLREAALAARLEHPFAAHIYAFGSETDGLLWIGMEYVRGAPLDDLLRRSGPLSLDVFLPLFERICEVVASAHEQGIVHRDIKPANVMVMSRAGKRVPKLLDFGIATAFEAKGPAAPALAPALALVSTDDDGLVDTMPLPEGGPDDASGRLTRAGATIGSPPYMAPEQWVDSSTVDHAADIYALGILAYEALHGRPPFSSASYGELAEAHLSAPPPPVSQDLPPQLNDFFNAALAKSREARPPSAIALAELFASCSGVRDQPLALDPAVDDALALFAVDGPQPIAELCAALSSARNPHEALGLADEIDGEVARYLGLLALAARNHAGPPPGGDPPQVAELLRDLRNRALDTGGWLTLARALVSSAEHHPLPELVELLARLPGPDSDSAHKPAAKGAEALRQTLDARLAALAARLTVLEPLCDYPIVLARDGYAERWMGQRGRAIASAPLSGLEDIDTGVCHLADLAGRPVLDLDPLILVREPSAGADAELFVLDGAGRRGARYVSRPQGFEIEAPELWEWLREQALLGDTERSAKDTVEEPYPGLVTFTRADAGRFFGRELEAEGCLNRLRAHPILCVVGPSGSGKSSFVQAGLLAALDVDDVYVRPGKHPNDALAAALRRAGVDPDDAPITTDRPIVVVVDQLEELFTLCRDPEARDRFAEAIAALPASPGCRVVMTLRDDFLIRAQALVGWRGVLEPALKLLATPAPADLRRALAEPARQVGYTWDDATLPDEIVEAVADEPNALALLAFSARQLWERRDRGFHRLTRRAYDDMGGVAGAIARHAESVIEDMGADDRALVRKLFRHLVTAEGTRAVLRRDELLELSGDRTRGAAVLERLLAARLLHTGEGDDEGAVELAHEALLSSWPRLAEWLRLDAEGARLRDELRAAAKQWDKRERPDDLLWRGDTLAELRAWVERHGGELTSAEAAFVEASNRLERQGRSRRRVALGAVIAVLLVAVTVLVVLNQRRRQAQVRAEASARESRLLLIAGYEEQGRQTALRGDCMQSLLFLENALELGSDNPTVRFLLARCAPSIEARKLTLRGHKSRLWNVSFSPRGDKVVTAGDDSAVIVWDSRSGAPLLRLEGHGDIVYDVQLDPAGERVVSASADKTARVWDAGDGRELAIMRGHEAPVWTARFSPDGSQILTTALDGTTRLWDAKTGASIRTVVADGRALSVGAEFSPDGTRAITPGAGSTARLWGTADWTMIAELPLPKASFLIGADFDPSGRRVATITGGGATQVWSVDSGEAVATLGGVLGGNVNAARFSPNGDRIVATDVDQSAAIWTPTGERLALLRGHEGAINSVAFSADGSVVATGGMDGIANLWDAGTGARLMSFTGHTGPVWKVTFAPNDNQLITASWDHTAQLWSARPQQLLASRVAHDAPLSTVLFTRDGSEIITASHDGALRVWDLDRSFARSELGTHAGGVNHAAVSADGRWLASGGADRAVKLWNVESGSPVHALEGHTGPVTYVDFSPDSKTLASAGAGGAVKLWDVASGAERRTLRGAGGEFASVHFSPDGRRLLEYGYPDATPAIWDLESGAEIEYRGHTAGIVVGAFSPDGQLVVTSSEDKSVHVWRAATGEPVSTTTPGGGGPSSVDFSPDGRRVVIGSDDAVVRVADAATGEIVGRLVGHRAHVPKATYTPDGEFIVTVSFDYSARIWSAATFRLLAKLEGHRGGLVDLAIRGDGTRLVTGGMDGRINLWNLARDDRDLDAVERLVRCSIPFTFKDGLVVPDPIDATRCR